jgi:hypothetical protein
VTRSVSHALLSVDERRLTNSCTRADAGWAVELDVAAGAAAGELATVRNGDVRVLVVGTTVVAGTGAGVSAAAAPSSLCCCGLGCMERLREVRLPPREARLLIVEVRGGRKRH